ncbi:ribonuclease E [Microbacteriaceae bacterium MWH-Ta3]|nr:ribonuclease E [Microbacteriaceae bacterium MWH-Ta3]
MVKKTKNDVPAVSEQPEEIIDENSVDTVLLDVIADEATESTESTESDESADAAEAADATEADTAVVEAEVAADAAPSKPEFEPIVLESPTQLVFRAPDLRFIPVNPVRVDEDDTRQVRRRERNRNDRQRTERREQIAAEVELPTEPTRIKGSTRIEAKRQRRRDNREIGRRRPVVTETEFLARRESVDRVMVVRSKDGRIQIGVLEDKVLVEHYVARSQEASLIGNVYLGKVQNVLPSMEAAFVDIGRGRNAVLYSGEVDWDAANEGNSSNQPRRIELALKSGDQVLVQVTKDPVGHKGARLTSQVSLPGRYVVYVPSGSINGISRKLPDSERSRLKGILSTILPETAGVIVRTAAEGATEEQLTHDVSRLTAQWDAIQKKVEGGNAPTLLHSEPDLLVKIIRDVFNEDFKNLVIHGEDAYSVISDYLAQVAPDLLERIIVHNDGTDPFDSYRINEQIVKALDRKVWLPSGGSLIIDRTEAMTVIDVNTGKFVGSGGNLEETVTKNNLEAAEEIVRQLRLRDIGGIVVVDFIDMVLESNRDLVQRRLIECLGRDRTKHQVAEITSLGLIQMTRKKLGLGLLETFSEACDVCAGRGIVVHHEPVGKARSVDSEQPSSNNSRRRKGNSNGSAKQSANHNGTHEITDSARNALAAIAASTVHAVDDVAKTVEGIAGTVVDEVARDLDSLMARLPEAPTTGERTARRPRRARSKQAPTSAQASSSETRSE